MDSRLPGCFRWIVCGLLLNGVSLAAETPTTLFKPPSHASAESILDMTAELSVWDAYLQSAKEFYDSARDSGQSAMEDFQDWSERDPTMRKLQDLYQQAQQAGETAANNVFDWTREDLAAHGKWEYRVRECASEQALDLEAALNDHGKKRWECFQVLPRPGGSVFLFLRRPAKSYIRALPAGEFLRIFPAASGESSGSNGSP